MHGKCQAWGPQGKCVACPCLPAKDTGSFSQRVPLVSPDNTRWSCLCCSLALDPEGPGGKKGVHKRAVITTAAAVGIYSAQMSFMLWEKKRTVLAVISTPFCFSASCQTLESTHRQKRVRLSVNKGYLFKMRINSEFWQLSVWEHLLWGWGKGRETCCLQSPGEKLIGCF